jgi:methyl-accepting chemotaxis protein
MHAIRQLETRSKVLIAIAILFCVGALPALWQLSSLTQISELSAGAARKLSPADAGVITRMRADAAFAGIASWAALAAQLALAAALARWLAAEAARPVQAAIAVAHRVAGGDLSTREDVGAGGGALLHALQEMNDKLVTMIVRVRGGTEAIVSGAGAIANGSMDLSSRTEQQAASLEETASSMEQLTATVKQNADHAHQASRLAVSASEVAVKGGAVVAEVVGTMASINDSSKRIAEIIGVIDGIAFQTNILALNAAVEAARAGEQGRGFAVVASEVRNLAQRSAAAAKEIKALIDDSVEKVNAGTELADKAGSTMQEVVTSVKRVTDIIGEIANASAEQTAGIEQVNHAITAMDQATQQNAALVEESAAAAAAVREQAGSLGRIVGAFVLGAPHARAPGAAVQHVALGSRKTGKAPTPAGAVGSGARARTAPPSAAPRPAAARARTASKPARQASAAPVDADWEEF